MKKIVIAGGSGFLGRALAAHFQKHGYAITILTRFPGSNTARRSAKSDGTLARPGDWVRELEGAAAVINLTGRSVNCRYHERNRKLILESRVNSTRVIGQAIAKCKAPPLVWLNSSTATIYKHTFGPAWDESGEIGALPKPKTNFPSKWRWPGNKHSMRHKLRALERWPREPRWFSGETKTASSRCSARLTRLGLGGKMGNGRQFVSWIHENDFCRAVEWLITHDVLERRGQRRCAQSRQRMRK